jgi:hypothetical protein
MSTVGAKWLPPPPTASTRSAGCRGNAALWLAVCWWESKCVLVASAWNVKQLSWAWETAACLTLTWLHAVPHPRRLIAGFPLRWPGFAPMSVLWDLWRAEWQRDSLFSEFIGYFRPVSLYRCSVTIHVWSRGRTVGPLAASVPPPATITKHVMRNWK